MMDDKQAPVCIALSLNSRPAFALQPDDVKALLRRAQAFEAVER